MSTLIICSNIKWGTKKEHQPNINDELSFGDIGFILILINYHLLMF